MAGPVGILGGTFDPIHFGHLRTALELVEEFALERLFLVPTGTPPHRRTPSAPAEDRLAMLELAVAGEPRLVPDDRELRRAGPSYTVDTLHSFRDQLGPRQPLLLCVGADSWLSIDSWSRYPRIVDYAHIVVLARPGFDHNVPRPAAFAGRDVTSARELYAAPAGAIHTTGMTPLDISATQIRELVASGRSARYLLSDTVWSYMQQHGLYRPNIPQEVPTPQ